ncbi:MAG TPA: hypothetical protein DEF89_28190 [Desulfosporosinus sp.]|nr:hypothetical protein [Desulfosporosinus sp.]
MKALGYLQNGLQFLDELGTSMMISDPIPNGSLNALGPVGVGLSYADNVLGGIFVAIGKGGKFIEKGLMKFGEGAGSNVAKGWKVGDPIDNLTKAGNQPSWSTVRQRHWKNESYYNSQNYPPENIVRMQKGLAPQRFNELTGKMESMELHHVIPQRSNLPGINNYDNLRPVWPDEHQLIDPYRKTGR